MKKAIPTSIIAGLIIIAVVSGAFYVYVGANSSISQNGEHWNHFGGYFGGVAGALFSFASIILVTSTLILQSEQLSDSQHENFKRDILAHVTKIEEEINSWLGRRIAVEKRDGETIEFGDVVWQICETTYVSRKELKTSIARLNKLTFFYCESLALYRDNINSHFIFKYHHQKAQSLIDFIGTNSSHLNQEEKIVLEFSQNHLNEKQ